MTPKIILSIKISRRPEICYLNFSDHTRLPLCTDDLIKLGLKSDQEITSGLLDELSYLSASFFAYDYSLRQLAISPKPETVLRKKIKNYLKNHLFRYHLHPVDNDKIITDTIVRLKKFNLINSDEYISYFLKRHHTKSPRYILYSLSRLGFSPEDIQSHLSVVNEEDIISNLIARRPSKLSNITDMSTRNKLIAGLIRKGFSYALVKKIIDDQLKNR